MTNPRLEDPFHRSQVLATLLSLAGPDKRVDLENATSLWALGIREEDLWELNEQGAVAYESLGDEGFAAIEICYVNAGTHAHLRDSLVSSAEQRDVLQARINDVLQHDPERLRRDIADSEVHIKDAMRTIRGNPLLQPLESPLQDIERHFSSIRTVARNYEDVYKNILKPMQDEGRKGIRATVMWAVVGIVASLVISNASDIGKLLRHLLQ